MHDLDYKGSTPILFLMVDSADHVSGKPGLAPTVAISKAGGALAAPAGAVSEVGDGWYKVAGDAADSGALGPLALHATAAGADPTDAVYTVRVPGVVVLDAGTVTAASASGGALSVSVSGLAGEDGQYEGRRLYVTFADGSHLLYDPCTAHAVAGGVHTFTVPTPKRSAQAGDSALVVGS